MGILSDFLLWNLVELGGLESLVFRSLFRGDVLLRDDLEALDGLSVDQARDKLGFHWGKRSQLKL